MSVLTSGEVLKDGGRVDGSGGTNTTIGGRAALQETMDTTDRELKAYTDGEKYGKKYGDYRWTTRGDFEGRKDVIPARAEREMGFFLSPAPLIPMVPLAPLPESPFAPLPDMVLHKWWEARKQISQRRWEVPRRPGTGTRGERNKRANNKAIYIGCNREDKTIQGLLNRRKGRSC